MTLSRMLLAGCVTASMAAPAFAQAPNDAAYTLRRAKAYSDGTGTRHLRASQNTPGNKRRAYASRTSASSAADHSADALNAQQLGRASR